MMGQLMAIPTKDFSLREDNKMNKNPFMLSFTFTMYLPLLLFFISSSGFQFMCSVLLFQPEGALLVNECFSSHLGLLVIIS